MKLCLVVDDFEVIRRITRPMVEELGYLVIEAADAESAVSHCVTEMPDVIILDWTLPDAETHSLIASIRAEPTDKFPVIIYMSTENNPADLVKALNAGADGYIIKPFHRETLQDKITQLTTKTPSIALVD
ncbi:MAG: response regulator [Pseudomonadota bacterium]